MFKKKAADGAITVRWKKGGKKIKESFGGIFSLPKVKYQAMAQIVSSKLFRPAYFKTLRFSADR